MKVRIQVSSDIDYRKLVAEVLINDQLVGIVSDEPGEGLAFTFHSDHADKPIPLATLEKALQMAKDEIMK